MTLKNYIIGYALSLLLTALSFGIVWTHVAAHMTLLWLLFALALVQIYVQVIYFLHIGRTSKGADIFALSLATLLVIIVVGGSLWIMTSLNDRMMPSPEAQMQYMLQQDSAM